MEEDGHDFKPLKIERDGRKVQACQECGALKIGEDTIVVDKDYIDLAPLTSDPALAGGRVWFRGDTDETRWSPDGSIVEIWETASAPGATYDLASIKGFTYLATGTPTDSWYFTADPNQDVWIRQYSTNACFQPKYQFYGTYAHWTADNTFVDVVGKAANVYGDGEVMSVAMKLDGTKVRGWSWQPYMRDPHGICWNGEYFYQLDNDASLIYEVRRDGTATGTTIGPDGGMRTGITWGGQYFWTGAGGVNGIYQYKTDGTRLRRIQAGKRVEGVAWDGQYLYATIGAATGPGWIYKIDPVADAVVNSANVAAPDMNGIAFDGNYLYLADDDCDYIYTHKASDLTRVDKGWNEPGWPWGICWDGKYAFVSHRGGAAVDGPGHVYQYGATGAST